MTTHIRTYAKIAGFNLLLLAFLLLISEGAYRALYPEKTLSVRTFPGEHANRALSWARPTPEFGWVFSGRNLDTFKHAGKSVWTASVNQDGFRSTSDYGDIRPKNFAKRIMVLGDSFTFGPYINDPETLPAILQQKLGRGYEVYNFAIPGWGIDQMYLAFLRYVDKVDPDFVILVYIDDDILRVFESFRTVEGLNKPSFAVNGGRLRSRNRDKPGVLEWLATHSLIVNEFYNKVFRYRESKSITEILFAELSRQTRRRAQELIVFRYPVKTEVLKKQRGNELDLGDFFKSNRIMYMDPFDEIVAAQNKKQGMTSKFYLAQDSHPAKDGNDFVANYILRNSNIQARSKIADE
jgi:hypothetical protein